MSDEYITQAQRFRIPTWVRGAAVGLLGAGLIGNLGLITYSMWPELDAAKKLWLGLFWILGLIGFVILVRLWNHAVGTVYRVTRTVDKPSI
jgi:hypothetical protein